MAGFAASQLPTASTVTRAPARSSSPSSWVHMAGSPCPWKVRATFGRSVGPLVNSGGSAARIRLADGEPLGDSAVVRDVAGDPPGAADADGWRLSQAARGAAPSATAAPSTLRRSTYSPRHGSRPPIPPDLT